MVKDFPVGKWGTRFWDFILSKIQNVHLTKTYKFLQPRDGLNIVIWPSTGRQSVLKKDYIVGEETLVDYTNFPISVLNRTDMTSRGTKRKVNLGPQNKSPNIWIFEPKGRVGPR